MGLNDGLSSLEVNSTTVSGTTQQFANFQAGSGVTSAGSNVWITFSTAFENAPIVTASAQGTANRTLTIVNGSRTAGSAYFISHGGASVTFDWLALGD